MFLKAYNEPESNEPNNNDGSITFDQNLSIDRLLINLRIDLCESDEETWININSRLETIFRCSKDLKTQLDRYQKNKYLQLIDMLSYSRFENKFPVNSLTELSLNSFLKEHEDINSYKILRGSNNNEYLIESDDKQTFSKKEFNSENLIDDECLTESDENDENDKENHKKIIKQKEWSTIAHSLLFPESDDLSLQIKFQDNSIYLDLGDNDYANPVLNRKWVRFQIKSILKLKTTKSKERKYNASWHIKFLVDKNITTIKKLVKAGASLRFFETISIVEFDRFLTTITHREHKKLLILMEIDVTNTSTNTSNFLL
ncbi:11156_t:CDS:2 [Racocetra fulgida]|uniref:11156_t:CDS:1 n=1 Tax=Racocetra fulgida TaxID=60492 RepID=A0A9N9FXI2_9GLOM|nr:11156_t:CDS:2 [Racocetra fulgida]